MGYYAAPVTGSTPMTLADPHPGNRLMRHFGLHAAGVNVFIVDGVATTRQPANLTGVRVIYGGHVADHVTVAEAAILGVDPYDSYLLTEDGFNVLLEDGFDLAAEEDDS